MAPDMGRLMAAGLIRGCAEALVLVEASVGAEVAAEADLVIGDRFELASDCRKDEYYAKRLEAGWAAHLPPGRVEVVYARTAAPPPLMLPDSLVMQ